MLKRIKSVNKETPKYKTVMNYIILLFPTILSILFYIHHLTRCVYSGLFHIDKSYFDLNNESAAIFDGLLSLKLFIHEKLFFFIFFCLFLAGCIIVACERILKESQKKVRLRKLYRRKRTNKIKNVFNLLLYTIYRVCDIPIVKNIFLVSFIPMAIFFGPFVYFMAMSSYTISTGKSNYIAQNQLYCEIIENKTDAELRIFSNSSVPYDLYFTKNGIMYKQPYKKNTLLHKFNTEEIQDMINLCVRNKAQK